jgi:hypothetical protein
MKASEPLKRIWVFIEEDEDGTYYELIQEDVHDHDDIEYIRADLHTAVIAERDAARAEIARLQTQLTGARAAALREALDMFDAPRKVSDPYRNDGFPSKNDKCCHGHVGYEDCEACVKDAILDLFVGAPASAEPSGESAVTQAARITALGMANGLDMAAEAEELIISGLELYVAKFQDGDKSDKTMRALRVYNEAKSNWRRFAEESAALRALAGEAGE